MSNDNDKVGYRHPPTAHQWQKGVSGNPSGRKAGSRGLKTDLAAELDAIDSVPIGKTTVTGRRQLLMARTLTMRAARGDLKAAALLLPLLIQVLGIEDRGGAKATLSASDQALLDELLGEAQPKAEDGDTKPGSNDDQTVSE